MLERLLTAAVLALAMALAPALAQDTPAPEPTGPSAEEIAQLPEVSGVRISNTPERARLVLDLTGRTEFAIVSLDGPNRIAVDVRVKASAISGVQQPAGEGLVTRGEVQTMGPDRVRTYLTLLVPAQVQQAYVLDAFADQPARLVVDMILDTPENFARRVGEDLTASQAHAGGPGEVPLAEVSTIPGGSEVVREGRPLVVIDPGHGGIDNGASTPNGVHEKDIVLAFALKLQELLVQTGKYDVALTRDDDTFLRLEERVTLARQNKADLFISLHADSFQQPEIRGASVYTRDERATDVLDKVLADNENRSDIVAGFTVPDMSQAVVDILVDLMRREMRRQSFLAAQALVAQLEPSVALRRFPVRQADFFVLQAPDVPSVLVELGFLSNAQDINNLMTDGWQDRVTAALARGIASYFDAVEAPLEAEAAQDEPESDPAP